MHRIISEKQKNLLKMQMEECKMKKRIFAMAAAAVVFVGAATGFMGAGKVYAEDNTTSVVCPWGGYGACQGENCIHYENCPNDGIRPMDGTGMQNGRRGGGSGRGIGNGSGCGRGVCRNS